MPELPEVETIRRDLKKKILGKEIRSILVRKNKIVKSQKNYFIKNLKNNSFVNIDRIGKLNIFILKNKNIFLLIHLKMTGQLIYQDKKTVIAGGHMNPKDALPGKHTHVIFEFSDNSKLYFNDQRQFGYMQLVDVNKLDEMKNKFGIEPLTKQFTWENFDKIFKKRKTTVKALILNQQLIAGLGNIYADEVLFLAKIKPSRKVNTLTLKERKKLWQVINPLFKKAIKYRGTTFNNYVDSKGKKGNFSKLLKVFKREGLQCYKCKHIIKKTKVAGRGTHFCPQCQI